MRRPASRNARARPRPQSAPCRRPSGRPSGHLGWLAIAAFVGLYAYAARAWQVPASAGWMYLGCSLTCCVVYALDKSAAQAGRWRVQESTLLMLGLVGGWPGAILAQQVLRHKTSKPPFQRAFWASVLVNVAAFVLLASPQGRAVVGVLR